MVTVVPGWYIRVVKKNILSKLWAVEFYDGISSTALASDYMSKSDADDYARELLGAIVKDRLEQCKREQPEVFAQMLANSSTLWDTQGPMGKITIGKAARYYYLDEQPDFTTQAQQSFKQEIDGEVANGQVEDYALSDTKPTVVEGVFGDTAEISDQSFTNHLKKALEYKIHGKYDDSIMEYTKAIEISCDSAIAYFNRGELYIAQNKRAEAIADFEKVINLSENPELTKIAQQHIEELKQ